MSRIEKYIKKINNEICPTIEFESLGNNKTMKSVLSKLTKAFKDVYGTDTIYEGMSEIEEDGDFILAPGLVRAEKTGKVRIALLDIDVSSSGEHWGTTFFTEKGIFSQDDKELSNEKDKMLDEFIPYTYCYNISIPEDIHIDVNNIHPDMKKILLEEDALDLKKKYF